MIEDEKLCDHAALCYCPGNIEEGRKKLRRIATWLIWQDRSIEFVCVTALTLGAIALVIVFAVIIRGVVPFTPSLSGLKFWGIFIGGLMLLGVGSRGRRAFQTRKSFLTFGYNYDHATPPEIEKLLGELINSKFDALEDAPEGTKTPTARRLTSGRWVDPQIPPILFKNRYAPLLLTDDIKNYEHVWRPWGQTIWHTIFIIPGPNKIDETGKYQWLVLGTDRQFEQGLEAFINGRNIPTDRAFYFRTALRSARSTFLAWGTNVSRGLLLKNMNDALQAKHGEKPVKGLKQKRTKPVLSETVLKDLLRGIHSQHDIKRYFVENYRANSMRSKAK